MAEVKTNMAFSGLRRGQRLQVDLDDIHVQGLIKGGYVTVIEEDGDAGTLDYFDDPGWSDCLLGDGVASGTVPAEEEVDGPRAPELSEGDRDSA